MTWHKIKEPMIRSRRIQYDAVNHKVATFGVYIDSKDIRRLRQLGSSKLRQATLRLNGWLHTNGIDYEPSFATAVHGGVLYTDRPISGMHCIWINFSLEHAVRKNPIMHQAAAAAKGDYDGIGFTGGGLHRVCLTQKIEWRGMFDCTVTDIGSGRSEGIIELTHTITGVIFYVDENNL